MMDYGEVGWDLHDRGCECGDGGGYGDDDDDDDRGGCDRGENDLVAESENLYQRSLYG